MRFMLVLTNPCEALCSQVVVSRGAGKEVLEEYLLP